MCLRVRQIVKSCAFYRPAPQRKQRHMHLENRFYESYYSNIAMLLLCCLITSTDRVCPYFFPLLTLVGVIVDLVGGGKKGQEHVACVMEQVHFNMRLALPSKPVVLLSRLEEAT